MIYENQISIEEMKEMLVESEIDYVRDLVIKCKYDDLCEFICYIAIENFNVPIPRSSSPAGFFEGDAFFIYVAIL